MKSSFNLNDKKVRQASMLDGVFYCIMVGTGETYFVAFALQCGVSEQNSALIGIVPLIIGSVLQLATYRLAYWIGCLRKLVLILASLQAFVIIGCGVTALPQFIPYTFPMLMVLATIYWFCSLAAGPPWNAWIGELIPVDQQKAFFLRRNFVLQVATIVGLAIAVTFLHAFGNENPAGYAKLFVIAGIARLLSVFFLSRHPQTKQKFSLPMNFSNTRKWLGKKQIRYAFLYVFALHSAVYISAPYFVPYMLEELSLGILNFTILSATSFAARGLISSALHNFIRKHGVQTVFLTGYLLVVPIPLLWNLSDHFYFLLILQILAGVAWGMHEMGMTLFLLETIPYEERSKILSLISFASALAMLLGVMIGWYIVQDADIVRGDYENIFLTSTFLRILPMFLIFGFIHSIKADPMFSRILGIRPGFGFTRPILRKNKQTTKK